MVNMSIMESVCRLCFKISFDTLIDLKDSEALPKLKAFTMLEINTHPALPNKICTTCKTSIDECFTFHSKVVRNNKILMDYLEKGYETLNSFYNNIIEQQKVKYECNNSWNKTDIKENTINFLNSKTKTDNNLISDKIKNEYFFEPCNDKTVEYTSEDDISLSTVKALKLESGMSNNTEIKADKLIDRQKSYSEYVELNSEQLSETETEIKIEPVLEDLDVQKQFYQYLTNWKCLTCSDCFDNRSMLLSHYKMKHGCSKKGLNNSSLGNNCTFSFKVDGEKYKCLKCEKMYNQKRLILRHMNSHIEERPYICKVCGRTYKTASDIVRHGRAHDHVKMLSCKFENCSYSTAYMGALRDHEKRHCDDYKYKCEKCGKGFQVKTWYDQHQNIHTGDRPFSCHLCGRTFQMQRYLKTHISTVHPQASEVKRHMCTVCGTSCDTRHALNIHLKTHGIATTYLCDTCGKSLSSSQHLRLHSRVHQGIKPHICGTCGKSFSKKCNLQLHKRVHSGEKPFICSYCGKAFSQKSTLHIHVRYHTGSRPYKCENCTKSFVCQGLLSSHQKGCP